MLDRRIWLAATIILIAAMACSLPLAGEEEPTESPATAEPEVLVVTATPEPAPTATQAPEVQEETGVTATATQNLKVRVGPSTQYSESSFINQGQTVPVVGRNADSSWILISLPGGSSGWVSTPFTTIAGNLSTVPIVNVPPPSSSGGGGSSPTSAAPTATSSGGGASPTATSSGGGGQTAPPDSNISTELNIKNGVVNESGVISYPNGDTMDQVYINVVGFDSVTTSGDASFTLTCSGDGVGNVQVFGGGGCNQTWDKFFTDDSHQYTMRVSLESGSNAYVNWTLIVSANN